MSQAAKLRRELAGASLIVAPGAYDCMSAKVIERAGFSAVYMTGGGTAVSMLGMPDYGLLTMTEMADAAGRMARAIDVPLIADADTGFGNEMNAFRTVQEYERQGVAAIQIEDQVFPKRCGFAEGKQVVSLEEFEVKIRAATAARRNRDTVIVARTDAVGITGFEDAVLRMQAAVRAGADVAFIEGPKTQEQLAAIPGLIAAPCLLNLPPRSVKTPRADLDEAAAMGYRLLILPGLLSRHVFVCCEDILRDLQSSRIYPPGAKEPASMKEFANCFGSDSWDDIGTKFR